MAKLTLKEVEGRVKSLGKREAYDREFLFELMSAYGRPKSSITRLRQGSLNVAANPDVEVAQKNVVYFHEATEEGADALAALETLRAAAHVLRFTPRFIIATDYEELVALDSKTQENLIISIKDIGKHFTFFLPWAGMEKAQYVSESHADVNAAERMGKLFDELMDANNELVTVPHGHHALNVFFTRLLFCFFAEDTGIFSENQFTNAIGTHTQEDGSDVQDFLSQLFDALDTLSDAKKPEYLKEFPYVNGRLFTRDVDMVVPKFTKQARKLLIELGTLMWQEINPDIFGSMFQAIVAPGKRSDLGQHYTSVPNILKTIEPLFLDELRELFDTGYNTARKLEKLLERIANIKVFDPACGSGNFLVIAYKELRRLEHSILERLADLDPKYNALFTESRINVENFYGIEIDDFATEVAILSLWIAKHQMNIEFKEKFGVSIPLIPLKESGHIYSRNSNRTDWGRICPNNGTDEIYIIGNPPYGGSKKIKKELKEDYDFVFNGRPYSKNLDYVALWFIKGADYISNTNAKLSLVATNSVAQGEHSGLMFPIIFDMGIEIGFAYTSFKWENNAKRNAGVTVVVVGLRNKSQKPKYIYSDNLKISASNINGYLADGDDIFVLSSDQPISPGLPVMQFGNMALDGGNLLLDPAEREDLISNYPEAKRFLRKIVGSKEYINGLDRYCLWICEHEKQAAESIQPIASRIKKVKEFRESSRDSGTRKKAQVPWRFREQHEGKFGSIIVPSVSSENREYIPIGYVGSDTVISNLAFAIYDAEPWVFALLTSRMHMVWVAAIGGKLETRYRYSKSIVYNNFPVPSISNSQRARLAEVALRVLDVREYHCEKTLAQLYTKGKMPEDLVQAHRNIDDIVDSIYSPDEFRSDGQRLATLLAMYEDCRQREVHEFDDYRGNGSVDR